MPALLMTYSLIGTLLRHSTFIMQQTIRPITSILLIDDDPDDCDVFKTALSDVSSSIHIQCLHSSEQLQATLAQHLPDVIFLDINMPMVDGFACLKQLQDNLRYSRIPIIMYSSSLSQKEINAAYGYGASLFFRKPTRYADLLDSLKSILLMDWNNPDLIKQQYFKEGNYETFDFQTQ
jgi:CheY-like chemotaxis protein